MKVGLCCIAKLENQYIREFIEHYRDIGVDKIFIYDNNDKDGELISDAVSDFIKSGFVDVIDYRGKKLAQKPAYNECYKKHGKEYDWFLYFDCDEFLEITDGRNVKEFLTDKKYNGFQSIHVNWMVYGDGGHVTNDGRPLKERIPEPVKPFNVERGYDFPDNNHIKTMVRGGLNVEFKNTPHTPTTKLKTCNCEGKEVNFSDTFQPYCFDNAYLRHYVTKTIEEYTKKKLNRGSATTHKTKRIECRDMRGFSDFFKLNEWTIEKQMFINEHIKEMKWVYEMVDTQKTLPKSKKSIRRVVSARRTNLMRREIPERVIRTTRKNDIRTVIPTKNTPSNRQIKKRKVSNRTTHVNTFQNWNSY